MRWLVLACMLVALPARADVANESIGPVRHGMTDTKVARVAGAPATKGAPYYAGEATGDWQKDWTYAGAVVTFYADTKTGPKWTIRTVGVTGGRWKTKRGIAIGATRGQVEKAYAKVKDKDASSEEQFVAGSVYGGIVFEFADDQVKSMFVGAAAF